VSWGPDGWRRSYSSAGIHPQLFIRSYSSAVIHPLVFIRWAKRGVWERLFELVQQRGIALGMGFIDGPSIRAQHKAAGAKKGGQQPRARSS
jgi:transposase